MHIDVEVEDKDQTRLDLMLSRANRTEDALQESRSIVLFQSTPQSIGQAIVSVGTANEVTRTMQFVIKVACRNDLVLDKNKRVQILRHYSHMKKMPCSHLKDRDERKP